MKKRKITLIGVLMLAMASFAQTDEINRCQLSFVLPPDFEATRTDKAVLCFKDRFSQTSLTMSKGFMNQGNYNFSSKTVSMSEYNKLRTDPAIKNLKWLERSFKGVTFQILTWREDDGDIMQSYNAKAISDECGLLYSVELSSDEGDREHVHTTLKRILGSARFMWRESADGSGLELGEFAHIDR